MTLVQFPILATDRDRAKVVGGRTYSASEVYREAYRIGRSIWDATRPDRRGDPIPRATPSALASVPEGWYQWPDDIMWSVSAAARWCIHVGLAFVEIHMPREAPAGVYLANLGDDKGRIAYPLAMVTGARADRGVNTIDAWARAQGWAIDWSSEIEAGSTATSAVRRITDDTTLVTHPKSDPVLR